MNTLPLQRTKIEVPEIFPFSMELDVRITDLNYGNHVGNQQFLVYAHEARVAYFANMGFTEMNVGGTGIIMADAQIEYKQELRFGDRICVEVAAGGYSAVAFDLIYRISKLHGNTPTVAAIVKTGMVCFDYLHKKVLKLSQEAKQKLYTTTLHPE